MTPCDGCLRQRTANNSHNLPLLFKAPDHRLPRIYAVDEMSLADKSLQKTARTASLGAAAKHNPSPPRKRSPETAPLLSPGAGSGLNTGDRWRERPGFPVAQAPDPKDSAALTTGRRVKLDSILHIFFGLPPSRSDDSMARLGRLRYRKN